MNYTLTLLSALAITCSAYSQETTLLKAPDYHRFQVGLSISPEIAYRKLYDHSSNKIYNSYIPERNHAEKPIFSYTMGMGLTWNFNRHIGIETGLQYSRKGYQFPTGAGGDENVKEATNTNSYTFVDVPLKINFTFGKQRLRFIGSLGAALDIPGKSREFFVIVYNEVTAGYKKDMNVSALISAGVDYRINRRINLRLEPNFRITTIPRNYYAIAEHLWNAGLNVGCYIGF